MSQPLRFSFIIPVRDDARRLARCLDTVRLNFSPAGGHEIIVGDNGSTDDSAEVATNAGAKVLSVPGQPVAVVRNQAAALATGDILAFVDADHLLGAEWIAAAQDVLADDKVVATGAPCHAPADGTWVQRLYDAFRDHSPGRVDTTWLGSGNLAVRREVFKTVGGFDASLETCEDVDLCKRLLLTGGRLLSDSRMENIHVGDPRTLKALFWGEFWRGRDNLRVSLRPPFSPRDLPSLIIPMISLAMIVGGLAALVGLVVGAALGQIAWLRLSGVVLALAVIGLAGFSLLRTMRMVPRLNPRRGGDLWRAFAVAATYDLARALALVLRVGHKARRKSDPRSATTGVTIAK